MDSSVDTIKCTYKLGTQEKNPHILEQYNPTPKKIYDDVLDAIGNTPMIRINKIGKELGIQCQLLAKCQFMNMGGSVKDRIGRRMVIDAEKSGVLQPGKKIVEATSGNTGIGLALASAVKGYECIICMPQKMSAEKANVLKGLGATIIRTPTQAAFDAPESHLSIANKMHDEGKAILLDQYKNPANPLAHYDTLAEEILFQCDKKVDAVIIGVGTGGTITGVGRKFKQVSPQTIIVGADPFGSVLAMPQQLNIQAPPNKVEGIGYDFVPRVLDRKVIDHWVKTDDPESFCYARKLISQQGLLVGGSSGAVIQALKQFVKAKGWENDKTKRIVCVFSDSIRNYITKFLSKQWCIECGFIPFDELKEQNHPWNGLSISELKLPEIKAYEDLTVKEAKQLFQGGAKIIPLQKGNQIYAAINPKKFLQLVLLKKLGLQDSALKAKSNESYAVLPHTLDVAQLQKCLQRHEAVIIQKKGQDGKIQNLWIATASDVFKLMK